MENLHLVLSLGNGQNVSFDHFRNTFGRAIKETNEKTWQTNDSFSVQNRV